MFTQVGTALVQWSNTWKASTINDPVHDNFCYNIEGISTFKALARYSPLSMELHGA